MAWAKQVEVLDPVNKIPLTISDFSSGLHVKRDATSIPDNAVSDCLNVWFDDGAPASRRPGYIRWSSGDISSRAIRTIFPWERSNGTRVIVVGVRNTGGGGTNEAWQFDEAGAAGGAAITGGTGFTTTYEMEFMAALDHAYMANGADALQRYDGTTMLAAGVDGTGAGGGGSATRPSAPTTALAAGGSIPAGTYQHSVSFVYGSRGESWYGTEGTARTTAAGNLQIDLSVIPLGPTGCTARRIYRRDTAATTNPAVFVGELSDNTTTIFSDTNAQLDNARRGRNASAIPPVHRYPYFHKNRALYLWPTGDRSRFWWSELRTPDIVLTASSDYVSRDDGQDITGGASFRDRFVFFKSRSVYVLEGDGPSDWRTYPISRTIGCSHNRSIQVTPRGVIFMGQEGFWLFDGVGLKFLSDAIEPDFKNILQGWNDSGLMEWTTMSDFSTSGSTGGIGGAGLGVGTAASNFVSD